MTLKSDIKKLEYGREYYKQNREKVKARRRERWAEATPEQREQQRLWSREWYNRNSDKSKQRTVEWMRKNKELVNARVRLSRYKKQGKTELIEREERLIESLLKIKNESTTQQTESSERTDQAE